MKLPFANEGNVDLGIYRELVEMAKARVDVVEIVKNYYVRQLQHAEAENDRLRKSDAQNRERIAKLQGLVDVHLGRISNAADIIKRKDVRIAELLDKGLEYRQKIASLSQTDGKNRKLSAILANIENVVKE